MTLHEQTIAGRADGSKNVVPFFTAGYPDEETTLRLVIAAAEAGCKIVELGIPFSDPIADGPTIQASSQHALAGGMTLSKTLRLADRARREASVAIVLMGYYNPILRMGPEIFSRAAGEAGVAGVIIPDLPLEESGETRDLLAASNISLVSLVARTSGADRIERIARQASGFLYLVSVTGVTGAASARPEDLDAFVGRVRRFTELPLYVGFGISSPRLAREATRRADGVIIGSALLRILQEDGDVGRVKSFLQKIQNALNPEQEIRS